MVEWLILVDENDNELGIDTRENCHRGKGKMHRAFVVFLFNSKNQLLLQKRSKLKQLWPEYWDLSVTSHVYPSETYEQAATRRLNEELGIWGIDLKRVLSFTYTASYGDYSENEYCVLLVGRYDGSIKPNEKEVSDYRYANVDEIARMMDERPGDFTPWFKISFRKFMAHSESKGYRNV